jgi:threonine/homoserine/homoserine lactone efflux protein
MTFPLASYFVVTFVLVITPGATTAVVLRNTLSGGWRPGVATAVGAAIANSTLATAAGLGLGLMSVRYPPVQVILRWSGGMYLGWLGVSSLRRAVRPDFLLALASEETPGRKVHSSFGQGLAVNLLNPAIIVFYLAVVPTFMPPSAGTALFTLLAAIHVTMAFLCHVGWAFVFSRLRQFASRRKPLQVLEACTAMMLIYLAARTIYP